MQLALLILLIIIGIILHEFGHIITMYRAGIRFKEVGIGYKFPFIPSLSFKIKNVIFRINHLPFKAYVKIFPDDNKKFEGLSYTKQAVVLGAGVLVNFIFSGVLLILTFLFSEKSLTKTVLDIRFMITLLILFALGFGYKFFCKYVMPIVGTIALGLLMFIFIMRADTMADEWYAIIPMSKITLSNLQGIFLTSACISLLLGITNTIPLCPLDGGLIIFCCLSKLKN